MAKRMKRNKETERESQEDKEWNTEKKEKNCKG